MIPVGGHAWKDADAVLGIRISLGADPASDPGFYFNADLHSKSGFQIQALYYCK